MEKSRITRFEDLDAWKKALDLALETHRALKNSSEYPDLARWLFLAVCKVGINIAQGFDMFYYEDKIKHYQKARSCAVKAQFFVRLAQDLNLINQSDSRNLSDKADMVKKMINGMLISLEKNKTKFSHKS